MWSKWPSIIPNLASLLASNKYDIHDFDERGVPENAGSAWRMSETAHWLQQVLRDTNRITVICDFIKPTDVGASLKDVGSSIQCILLDTNANVIRERLTQRYTKNGFFDSKQKVIRKLVLGFIEGNLYIRDQLKEAFKALNRPIVDTSNLTSEEAAKRIARLIK